jgi:hypothetical protein
MAHKVVCPQIKNNIHNFKVNGTLIFLKILLITSQVARVTRNVKSSIVEERIHSIIFVPSIVEDRGMCQHEDQNHYMNGFK